MREGRGSKEFFFKAGWEVNLLNGTSGILFRLGFN